VFRAFLTPAIPVDIGPVESERFTLAQTQCQRDSPTGAIPPLLGDFEQVLDLLYRVGFNLFFLHLRCSR
jgi:hypothetical protein